MVRDLAQDVLRVLASVQSPMKATDLARAVGWWQGRDVGGVLRQLQSRGLVAYTAAVSGMGKALSQPGAWTATDLGRAAALDRPVDRPGGLAP